MLKKILNASEDRTFQALTEACGRHGVYVFPKMRVADVIEIKNSGISEDLFSFALKAHFDFVATGSDHRARLRHRERR